MPVGAFMTVENATGRELTVSVEDVSGMKDEGDGGSWLARLNTTVPVDTGYPADARVGRGEYIESRDGGPAAFTLSFTGKAQIGSVRFSVDASGYAVAENSRPGQVLVTIGRAGPHAPIVILVLGTPYAPATWLTDLPALSTLPLSAICIPASHDGGCWSMRSSVIPEGAVLTQRLDITGQLHAGARYFDLRPALAGDGQLYSAHGTANCVTLALILSQASAFAAQHASEVLFLNFSHMDSAIQQRAWDEIVAALGAQMARATGPDTMLGTIQGSGRNILVFFEGVVNAGAYREFLWSPQIIARWGDYANTDSVGKLTEWITASVNNPPPVADMWLLQCQLTQSNLDAILSSIGLDTILKLAQTSKPAVQELLDVARSPGGAAAQAFSRRANFFMVDDYDVSWTDMAVRANVYRMRAPGRIALSAGGRHLYELRRGGGIYRYTGTPAGWQLVDANPETVAIVSGGDELYQLHAGGAIFRYRGASGWERIDANPQTAAIAANGAGGLFQLHRTGRIYQHAASGWVLLDNNAATASIAAGARELYQLHTNGRIFRYTGFPCKGELCLGWEVLDRNPATASIAAGGGELYQMHANGHIWRYTGSPCNDRGCHGWERIDDGTDTASIAVDDAGGVYKLQRGGPIWRYTGVPHRWEAIDNNPRTVAIAAGSGTLYQRHRDGSVWRYTGQPCTPAGCPGWQQIDAGTTTLVLATGTARR